MGGAVAPEDGSSMTSTSTVMRRTLPRSGFLMTEHRIGECLGHPEERSRRRTVLEPRQRRLRGQTLPVHRIPVEKEVPSF